MATRKTTKTARKAAKKAAPRKAAARKAPAKKTARKATKKSPASKAPAKKATARKTTAKKATKRTAATKSVGRSPARKGAGKTAPRKVTAKKAGTVAGRTTAVKKSAQTARKSAAKGTARAGRTPGRNLRKATSRPAGAAGVTEEEKSQRRRAARTDAATTIEPADGVTTNFGTATAATPRDTDRGTSRTRKAHRITPEEALRNTQELLEAKQERDRQPPPWRQLDAEHGQPGRDQATPARTAEQEAEVNARAEELHRAESRLDAIHGSVSQQDRHRQGRNDARD